MQAAADACTDVFAIAVHLMLRLPATAAFSCLTMLSAAGAALLLLQVSGIMMNEYTGADVTEKLHEEQWLTQLQETAREGSDRAVGSHTDSGSSSSSSEGAAAASAGGEEVLKAAAKDSLASGGQGTFVAAAAAAGQQEGPEGSSSTGKEVQQEKAAAAAAVKERGSNDQRLHHRPRQLLRGLARGLQQFQQQLEQRLHLPRQ
jgi:hypothetical protein